MLLQILGISSTDPSDSNKRMKQFSEVQSIVGDLQDEILVDGDPLLDVHSLKVISTEDNKELQARVTPGARVKLEVTLESRLPSEFKCDQVALSLDFNEPTKTVSPPSAKTSGKKVLKKNLSRGSDIMAKPPVRRTTSSLSGRSSSIVSTTSHGIELLISPLQYMR